MPGRLTACLAPNHTIDKASTSAAAAAAALPPQHRQHQAPKPAKQHSGCVCRVLSSPATPAASPLRVRSGRTAGSVPFLDQLAAPTPMFS